MTDFDARRTLLADLVAAIAERIGDDHPDEVVIANEPRHLLGCIAEEQGLLHREIELRKLLETAYTRISGGAQLPNQHYAWMFTQRTYREMLQLIEAWLRGPSLAATPSNPFLARHFLSEGVRHADAWVVRDPRGRLTVRYDLPQGTLCGAKVFSGDDHKWSGGSVVGHTVARYQDLPAAVRDTNDVEAATHAIAAAIAAA